jgi:hypothetical protein
MVYKLILGDWCVNGYLKNRGSILLGIEKDRLIEVNYNEPVFCRQYGNDAPIITNGVWEFMPDNGELGRVGLVPQQMLSAY